MLKWLKFKCRNHYVTRKKQRWIALQPQSGQKFPNYHPKSRSHKGKDEWSWLYKILINFWWPKFFKVKWKIFEMYIMNKELRSLKYKRGYKIKGKQKD